MGQSDILVQRGKRGITETVANRLPKLKTDSTSAKVQQTQWNNGNYYKTHLHIHVSKTEYNYANQVMTNKIVNDFFYIFH